MLPSLQQQLRSDAACYCPNYCEENVLRLAQHPLVQRFLDQPAHVLLISNARQQVGICHQHAGAGNPRGAVVWDYHVLLLTRALVLDLDSTLPFPTPTAQYLAASFERLPPALAPRFRLLSLGDYRARLASDRRHMVREDGSPAAPPPPWACHRGSQAAGAHTLGELVRMEPAAGDCAGLLLGGVEELLRALA